MGRKRVKTVDFCLPAAQSAAADFVSPSTPAEVPKVAILASTVLIGVTLGITLLAEELHVMDEMDTEQPGITKPPPPPTPQHLDPEPKIVLDAAALINASRRTRSPFLCQRRSCKQLGLAVAALIDSTSAKPCDDFSSFACGRWNVTDEHLLQSFESHITSVVLRERDSMAASVLSSCLDPGKDMFRSLATVYLKLTDTLGWPYPDPPWESPSQLSSSLGAIYRELRTENIFRVRTLGADVLSVDWSRLPAELPKNHFEELERCFVEMTVYLRGHVQGEGSLSRVGLWLASEYSPKCSELSEAQRTGFIRWKELLQSALLDKDLSKMSVCYPAPRSNFPPAGAIMNYVVFHMLMALTPFLGPTRRRYNWSSIAYTRKIGHYKAVAPETVCVRMVDRFQPNLLARSLFNKSYFGHQPYKLRELLVGLKAVFLDAVKMDVSSSHLMSHLQNLTLDLMPMSLQSNAPLNNTEKSTFIYAWLHDVQRHQDMKGLGLLATCPRLGHGGQRLWVPPLTLFNLLLHPADDSLRAFLLPRLGPRLLSHLHSQAVEFARVTPGSADMLVTGFDTLSACLRRKDAASGISAADLHGLRGALKSFHKEALTLVSDHRLDGAEHLSAMQLFFVLYAANTCGELRFGSRHRVNAILRNVPQFAEAFKCDPGAPMNPEEKCGRLTAA
ncbi:hypothetical protein HPB50_023358 [Hyalomma asiaticum]|uniref:Uncharacterized protein n=1 Tax=Hyalomma asiaticum TaxID=266040 RepID=A0ACB7TL57_HYAAI|nr:hypothetical protein HPB50_023358 [Hyalomma asiaticum]